MIKPTNNILKTKVLREISDQVCDDNYKYWKEKCDLSEVDELVLRSNTDLINNVLPAHTFSYKKEGNMLLKSIFGFNERAKTFSKNCDGILAKRFRSEETPSFGHMTTSDKLGHDIFIFAYLGIHNPYHRNHDDLPVRPFGIFIKKEVEEFAYCHGTLADVAAENDLIDRDNLDKYYLKPDDLRELKAIEISTDKEIKSFNHYFGAPEYWNNDDDYESNLYKKTGEMRYYKKVSYDDIEAVLWPFFTDIVVEGKLDMDENLDLYNSFKKVFPEIKIIKYRCDDEGHNWDNKLLESSFYSMMFYNDNGFFPLDAKMAIEIYK